jgi:hypothetical protein
MARREQDSIIPRFRPASAWFLVVWVWFCDGLVWLVG